MTDLTRQDIIEILLKEADGDIAKVKIIEKEVTNRILSSRKTDSEWKDKRYIKQHELSLTCQYLLEGMPYEDALEKAAKQVLVEHSELREACTTSHHIGYLDNMYDTATDDNKTEFRKMRDDGYLAKNDYKGKSRPKTGLKKIERAVTHKDKHDLLQRELDTLKASSAITNTEVKDINSHLGLGLTEEEKITILLEQGYKPSMICEVVGCNKYKVSRVKKKTTGD